MLFGLKEATIRRINSVFEKFPEVEEVILYGSRAKGNFKSGSDIDLVLKGEKISHTTRNKIIGMIDELLLPYSFDIAVLNDISHADLLEHIQRIGKIFYEQEKVTS